MLFQSVPKSLFPLSDGLTPLFCFLSSSLLIPYFLFRLFLATPFASRSSALEEDYLQFSTSFASFEAEQCLLRLLSVAAPAVSLLSYIAPGELVLEACHRRHREATSGIASLGPHHTPSYALLRTSEEPVPDSRSLSPPKPLESDPPSSPQDHGNALGHVALPTAVFEAQLVSNLLGAAYVWCFNTHSKRLRGTTSS